MGSFDTGGNFSFGGDSGVNSPGNRGIPMGKRRTTYLGIGGHYPDHSIPGAAGVYDSVIGYWRSTCDCGAVFVQFAAHSAKHIRGTARYSSGDTRISNSIGFIRLGTTSIGDITDSLAVDSGGHQNIGRDQCGHGDIWER